jgi:Rieske Fe-S protein
MAARRRFLEVVGGAIAAALGAAIALPATALLTFPTRRRTVHGGDDPIEVARLGQLPEGRPQRVTVRAARLRDAWNAFTDVTLGAAWLVRRGEKVQAFSTVCPHAGCAVDWEPEAGQFRCPCHASVFSPEGACVSGPAPRGLDPLACTVEDGRVLVVWRRFRQGVPDREPT